MVDIRWDAHSCVPLKADYDLASLKRHRDAGFDFVSINVGMDMTPIADVVSMIASFREQIARCPDFLPARSIEDVRAAAQQNKLAVGFDLEGAKPLLANPSTVALYAELGVRQVLLAYNRANEAAGGCYEAGAPLTALGAEFVHACEEAGIVVDCSHMNEETVMGIMEIARKPVVFSHSNARVLNGNLRNITDDMIDACAGLGGVIGVNGVSVFMPGGEAEADAMIRVIDYLAERVGTRHVGIGLDYVYDLELEELPEGTDPAYWFPPEHGYDEDSFKSLDFVSPEAAGGLSARLAERGYGDDDIAAIMGGNFLRVAEQCWFQRS